MTESNGLAVLKRNAKKTSRRSVRSSASIGIEISYGTIYMVQLKSIADEGLVFEKCRTVEFDPSLDLDSAGFLQILKAALKQFCGSSKEVSVWVAPQLDQARLHHIKVPKVAPAKLPGAVYWGLQREDAFLEGETVVDFQIEEEGEDEIFDITGALIERDYVERLGKVFSQAGNPLSGIGLPLLAFRNLVKTGEGSKPNAPVLICQLGQVSTIVSVLLKGRLTFTRSIPLGLQNLAEILVNNPDKSVTQEEACEVILNLGHEDSTVPEEQIEAGRASFALIQPVLERIIRQIERTIDYYQSNFETEPVEKVFVGGDIGARGRVFEFLSEKIPREVIAIDPFDLPGLQVNSFLPSETADRVVYGAAFGLALESYSPGINFAHTYEARQSDGKHKKIAALASLILVLVGLAAVVFYNTQRLELRKLKIEERQLANSREALGAKITEATIMEAIEEVKVLEEQRRAAINRYEALALLSEITRLTPENVSLLHISAAMGSDITSSNISTGVLQVDSEKMAADAEGTLLLKGVVTGARTSLETSLTIYIARLDQSRLFSKVEVDSTELVQSDGELNLTFTLTVETIAEIQEITKL